MTDATSSGLNTPSRDRRDVALDRALAALKAITDIGAMTLARGDFGYGYGKIIGACERAIADIETLRGTG